MTGFRTSQEELWAGSFGDEYIARNRSAASIAGRTALLARVLSRGEVPKTFIELGANIGLNLHAARLLLPHTKFTALEINPRGADELRALGWLDVVQESLLEFRPQQEWDFVLVSGVLIHINPDALKAAYRCAYECSGRYICLCEYYSPVPVEVDYRGAKGRLFKRDFAGDMLDIYPDLSLVDYGFAYHRDPVFPRDDTTWFLLRKA